MNDYKDLIEDLRLGLTCGPYRAVTVLKSMLSEAADAIEQLVKERDDEREAADEWQHRYFELARKCSQLEKERDAAVADLTNIVHDMGNTCICDYCIGCVSNGFREGCKTDDGDRWEWRGVQEDDDEKERNL